jgi:protein gp37
MAERSAIEWCDGTVNFWWGCTKVGPGCDNCYAEDYNNFRGNKLWGPNTERRPIKGAPSLLSKLQRSAADFHAQYGRPRRVFMQSMSDTFDNEADDELRADLFAQAAAADAVRIIFLTKRISNVLKMIPAAWRDRGWPKHIGLMVTVVTQREAERDIPRLLELKKQLRIPWVGVSIEPMLEPMKLRQLRVGKFMLDAITGQWSYAHSMTLAALPDRLPGLDWVIVGGESGKNARPIHPNWVRDIRRECSVLAAFLFKQWGEWAPDSDLHPAVRANFIKRRVERQELHRDPSAFATVQLEIMTMYRVGKHAAGRLLDGAEYLAFPKELQ